MNNVYCVCTTPDMYPHYCDHWESFKESGRELTFISDNTKDKTFSVGFTFNEDDLKTNLNFDVIPNNRHFWNCLGNRNIAWFFAHLRMLNFYLSYPNYDYYWFFDDDIRMSNWDKFFDGVNKDDSDFLSYFCFKKEDVVTQKNIPNIDDKTFSKNLWFQRFPGEGDNLPTDVNEYFGSFFPTTRFSNKALKTLLEKNKMGYYGYHEGYVPTILNYDKLKLNTIILPNNTSQFFDVNEVNITHKNIRITWEWL